ncbi:hypothetical protein [Pectobacterium polaris]|uniref:hypothetical protein n=1 Tax=Pectobacterium polaris TaxID=2042057 RepID=UPI000BB309B6|nr:hypothetical protein [Pectobacterium polaris]ASY78050.1 hypothetical protein BJJ97_20075 [Pectobacterium polaris]
MADYINSNILSQSYVHVEPEWLSTVKGKEKQEAIERIKNIIIKHAEERMKFFLYDDVDIDVSFEDGSIKARITAYGSVCILLNALNPVGNFITNYSSYREGIKTIVSDVARLSDVVNAEVLFQTKSRSKNEIIRVEARKGIVGSLENINKKINEISYKTKSHKKNSVMSIYHSFLELHNNILELMDNVNDTNDRELVKTALIDGVKNINLGEFAFDLTEPMSKKIHDDLLKERNELVKNLEGCK